MALILAAAAIGGKAAKPEMDRVYAALHAGYDRLISMVGPGVRLCDVFHEVVTTVQRYIPEYQRGHVGHSWAAIGSRRSIRLFRRPKPQPSSPV